MIKKAESISQIPKKKLYYRLTPTLLNSWSNIFNCEDYVQDKEDDDISYEDKVAKKMQEAKQEFINMLNRIPIPDNEYMKRGREFEKEVCEGRDEEFSPIVEKGAFQVTLTKKIEVNNIPILLYGVLDVLKAGRIIDIKRVKQFRYPKYKKSHQHAIYLELVPEAIDFTYIVRSDNGKSDFENYNRNNIENIYNVISDFLSYLIANDLFEIYKTNYAMEV